MKAVVETMAGNAADGGHGDGGVGDGHSAVARGSIKRNGGGDDGYATIATFPSPVP